LFELVKETVQLPPNSGKKKLQRPIKGPMRRVGWLYLSLADRVGTGRTTEALRMPVHSHAAQVMAMSYLMLATTTDPAGCRWLLHTWSYDAFIHWR
jgi:hypothetical protein